MNIFQYNSFYSSLIKSKKNQDIIDLIIRAKGFNKIVSLIQFEKVIKLL